MATKEEKFDIILSKNRLAREVKSLCKYLGINVSEMIRFDFDEIEKMTGVMNQPTAREILENESGIDI